MTALIDFDNPATVADALTREWLVACLCAEWCGVCCEYRPGFVALQACFPQAAFLWVDIETHADWADDFDIEDFPTLLIQHGDDVRFFGTMLPYPAHLRRTLESLLDAGDLARPAPAAEGVPDLRELLRRHAG